MQKPRGKAGALPASGWRRSGAVLLWVCCWLQPAAGQARSYTVSWLGVPVVDVTITVTENHEGTVGHYRAVTRRWFDTFYALDNDYEVELLQGLPGPSTYWKKVLERGNRDSLSVAYDAARGRAVYSNGLERRWQTGDHNLFSALMWVERHGWASGEAHELQVEVEGVTWHVTVTCDAVLAAEGPEADVRVTVIFGEILRGEPVLSTTDMLTHLLPGKGHQLRLSLNPESRQIRWIELGRKPFVIRARINKNNS